MRKQWEKAVISVAMAAALAVTGLPYMAQAHGTTDIAITKDMLKDSAPEDYVVNLDMQAEAKDNLYNQYFLKEEIQTVSINLDENNLNYLLQNAIDEPYVMTDTVTIGDQTISYAGLKTKGSYTLEHTATDHENSDRFSFTINFGKYVKKKNYGVTQNFYGLSKVSFNNLFFDKTMMKEYFALKLLDEMNLPTPEYGIAKLYINGNYYGVYFMVEAMDSTIVEQYLNTDKVSDYLTKPEATRLIYDEALDAFLQEDGTFDLSSVLAENDKGDYEASGVLAETQSALWESDDDTLQDVAKMIPTVLSWEKKLNQLSNGKDFSGNDIDVNSEEYLKLLESIMDVEETVRYFAVHSFLVQTDNMFSGQKNYGLYIDEDGKSMMVPWDYDLSFGCYAPSTAEETANYDLDMMYRFFDLFNVWEWSGQGRPGRPGDNNQQTEGEVKAQSMALVKAAAEDNDRNNGGFRWDDTDWEKQFYSYFPLFNVIYQNESLMEKYHTYMEDCTKVVSLGGTTTLGKTYTPAWFTSYIDLFTPQLEAAASEKLAENVTYLNGAKQPEHLLKGLPNLSKIMALRSVGVYSQVQGIETTVSGYGCDLYTLGNAMTGDPNNGGIRTIVDDKTSIFATTDYGAYNIDNPAASLTVEELAETSRAYQAAKEAIGCVNEANLTVYKMKDTGNPTKKYTISIPLDKVYAEDEIAVYSYTAAGITKLNTTMQDNICTGKTGSISYIAVLKTAGETSLNSVPAENDSVDTLSVVKVKLNKKKLTLKAGKSARLKLKNTIEDITWKSSNKKIVTVNKNGKVTAKKKGTAVIKAVYDGETYKCKVTVTAKK